MPVILVPLDNRPITYTFPQLIASIAGMQTLLPPRTLMGSLNSDSNGDAISNWLATTLATGAAEAALICADSIIYGGLIPARRSNATLSQLQNRARVMGRWKKDNRPLAKVYIQSSIMRVSDNYDNTEEKIYWARYGREIFAWSEALHQMSAVGLTGSDDQKRAQSAKLEQLEARIDAAVREDYLNTRRRNFQINRQLLDYAKSGDIDLLIFSQDDSSQHGLNILEKERLLAEAKQRNVPNVMAYAGADEVLMTMIARWLIGKSGEQPGLNVSFSPATGGGILSRYEGQTIADSVQNQLAAAGMPVQQTVQQPADLQFIIHTGGDRQGDHIWLAGQPDMRNLNTNAAVAETIALMESATTPVVLCDLAYANGADPILIQRLLDKPALLSKLWGYGGWNTSGNSLGSAIATAVARWYAQRTGAAPSADKALKDALFVRLADDWAYQANVRKELGDDLSPARLTELMAPYLHRLETALDYRPEEIQLSLPWQRSFEVEVQLGCPIQAAR